MGNCVSCQLPLVTNYEWNWMKFEVSLALDHMFSIANLCTFVRPPWRLRYCNFKQSNRNFFSNMLQYDCYKFRGQIGKFSVFDAFFHKKESDYSILVSTTKARLLNFWKANCQNYFVGIFFINIFFHDKAQWLAAPLHVITRFSKKKLGSDHGTKSFLTSLKIPFLALKVS